MTLLAASLPASAAGLEPTQYSVGNRPMTHPLEEIGVYFDVEVELCEEVSAWIAYDNGDHLDLACIPTGVKTENYVSDRSTQGMVIFTFDRQNLPLGRNYTFGIDAGSVSARHNPSMTNDNLQVKFEVPADLGEARFDIPDSGVIEKADHIWCYWGIETEPVGEPEFTLYREGVEIGKYPARVGWDWDLGQAYADFGKTMTFDRGVHYSLVLPAGSVCGMWRDDLLNREARLDFIGDYDPDDKPEVLNCTVEIDWPNLLRMVRFHFNDLPWPRPAEGAMAQLFEVNGNGLVAEAGLFINTQINCCEIDADFGGYPLEDGKKYLIVIPEGALIYDNPDGTVRFGKRQEHSFSGPAAIEGIIDDATTPGPLHDLRGIRVDQPHAGEIYIRDGKKIVWK